MSLDPTTVPALRIGDADREDVVTALGRHLSVGRLTLPEFESRLDTVYAATTRAELDTVLADLPAEARPSPPRPPILFLREAWAPWASRAWWMPWTLTGAVCLLIWVATSAAQGHPDYFWPIWVIGPWGAMLLAHTAIAGTRPRRGSTSSNASPVAGNSA